MCPFKSVVSIERGDELSICLGAYYRPSTSNTPLRDSVLFHGLRAGTGCAAIAPRRSRGSGQPARGGSRDGGRGHVVMMQLCRHCPVMMHTSADIARASHMLQSPVEYRFLVGSRQVEGTCDSTSQPLKNSLLTSLQCQNAEIDPFLKKGTASRVRVCFVCFF